MNIRTLTSKFTCMMLCHGIRNDGRFVLGLLCVMAFMLAYAPPLQSAVITSASLENGDRFELTEGKSAEGVDVYIFSLVYSATGKRINWGQLNQRSEDNSPLYIGTTSYACLQNGKIAVILDGAYEGIFVRASIDKEGASSAFERNSLGGFQPPEVGTRREVKFISPYALQFNDIQLETGEKKTHIIEVRDNGEKFINGVPFYDAIGALKFKALPDGTYEMSDPKGRYGKPPNEPIIIVPKKREESKNPDQAVKLSIETTPTPKPLPVVQPPAPKKTPEAKPAPTPSEEPTSSTPWSIIVVLIVAVIGLLWLLLKGRK